MSNLLEQLKKTFRSLIGNPDLDTVVGLDVGTAAIKMVQVKRVGGKIALETYGAVATGPYLGAEIGQIPQINIDAVVQAIGDLVREANVTAKKVVVSVQSSSSLIFVLPLPPVSDKQLAQVVPTEATKYIPVPLSEVNFDWWRIPNKTQQTGAAQAAQQPVGTEVLVAAIRKEVVRFYQTVIQKATLEPLSFEIETFSGMRSSFMQALKPMMFVDFGASSTRVAIIEQGVIRKFQTINRGSEYYSNAISKSMQMPFQRAERLKKEVGLYPVEGDTERTRVAEMLKTDTQYVLYEIQKTLLAYERERHNVVSRVVVMGGGVRMPGFLESMQEFISIPIEVANPFSRIQSPSFLDDTLKEVGPEFAIAVGAAIKQI